MVEDRQIPHPKIGDVMDLAYGLSTLTATLRMVGQSSQMEHDLRYRLPASYGLLLDIDHFEPFPLTQQLPDPVARHGSPPMP
jgi:hypothetical protein